MSVINVLVLVEDDLGSVITALNRYYSIVQPSGISQMSTAVPLLLSLLSFPHFYRTLVVLEPKGDQHTTEWLRNKCQSELWALFQNGNPQEVIPYTIALTSQLNQVCLFAGCIFVCLFTSSIEACKCSYSCNIPD